MTTADTLTPVPAPWYDHAAEREVDIDPGYANQALQKLQLFVRQAKRPLIGQAPYRRVVARVRQSQKQQIGLSQETIADKLHGLRPRLRSGHDRDAIVEALALMCDLCQVTVGLSPHDNQVMAMWALLSGNVVELATGEGKTLVAASTATLAALTGVPVHVVTVNDYLAKRDSELAARLGGPLGLAIGCIQSGMMRDSRREAYARPITYVTNKELVFDYLRDQSGGGRQWSARKSASEFDATMASGPQGPVLKGLHFAIVDEADSVLIDEARTPLILSKKRDDKSEIEYLEDTFELASQLAVDTHFTINRKHDRIELTDAGEQELEERAVGRHVLLAGARRRREGVETALRALHVLKRGTDYIVRNDAVEIVDAFTGRVMPDRQWRGGLQQFVELKEGLPPTPEADTLAQITYQRFFPRYRHLAGLSGTVREVEGEVSDIYDLPLAVIPSHRPNARRTYPIVICETADEKTKRIVERVSGLTASGRAVLISTQSITATLALSEALLDHGIQNWPLHAGEDDVEAEIVGFAGAPGRVTVATNMAGRGTDILLSDEVRKAGGLAVILTELHDARRIDRQFAGRAARQGDPGSVETILSLEDELVRSSGHRLFWSAVKSTHQLPLLGKRLAAWVFRLAQRDVERRHRRIRYDSLDADRKLADQLAFAGRLE